jgi:arabinofuranan 3-O-arabinosyltransferase
MTGAVVSFALPSITSPRERRVSVSTDRGSIVVLVSSSTLSVHLPASLGPTHSVRVSWQSDAPGSDASLGIAEVDLPAASVPRTVTLPGQAGGASDVVVTTRAGQRASCVARTPTVCTPALARAGEESSGLDRTFNSAAMSGALSLDLLPRPGLALDKLLLPGPRSALATASSTWVPDPAARAQAAVDDDPWTAWIASPLDHHPTLTVTLPRPIHVSWLRILETLGVGASQPLALDVGVGARHYTVVADRNGFVRFPSTLTKGVTISVTVSNPRLNLDSVLQTRSVLPVGISDVVLGEADAFRHGLDPDAEVALPCGFGPDVEIDGVSQVHTEVRTTVGAILAGAPARGLSCGAAVAKAGRHNLRVLPTSEFSPTALRWSSEVSASQVPVTPTITRWTSNERSVEVSPSASPRTLELHENANTGWEAHIGDVMLEPIRVDGWRQAWLVPAGASGTVTLSFAPDRTYRAALLLGLALALVLVLAVVWRRPAGVPWAHMGDAPRRNVHNLARMFAIAATALLIGGPAALSGAAFGALLVRGLGRRLGIVVVATLLTTIAAVLAPWPSGTTWPSMAQIVAAVSVSFGCGMLIGGLAVGLAGHVNADAPSAEPVAPR